MEIIAPPIQRIADFIVSPKVSDGIERAQAILRAFTTAEARKLRILLASLNENTIWRLLDAVASIRQDPETDAQSSTTWRLTYRT